jgi:hypothetical protein
MDKPLSHFFAYPRCPNDCICYYDGLEIIKVVSATSVMIYYTYSEFSKLTGQGVRIYLHVYLLFYNYCCYY